ncbi:F0F1 ATP synthase subunit A [Paenibacillus thiaminolyticus]|uniref:F0F1 ATP synthase subunit A n=1 Tax=Paenibacillus thiaminolyticus TaxID=49283 RepID=UPI00232F162F|nr:F0F1 ATP synthase subunit A [Paenibacillus thiaminolyticus]WCF07992.1 F0F1 ATP synthase subunit A [Paenibacillus thiaminolyticus]WII37290.1 F0F1 ATP synthase subunit A [Paenibacillus thiaminolyticus]
MHSSPIIEVGGLQLDLSIILTLLISVVVVFIIARLAVRNLSVENPSKMQNFMEWVVEFVQGIIGSAMDFKKGKAYISLGMTLILFIFVSNLLGLPFAVITEAHHPVTIFGKEIITTSQEVFNDLAANGKPEHVHLLWYKSPTADVSVTFGLAFMVFVIVNFLGLKKNRKHYLKHYLEPFPIFLPLNIVENLAKPIALGIRLYANIFAGEILISTLIGAGIFGLPFLAAWQGFSIFIGALQAFIFTMLTMVYIGQASIHEEH